MTEESVHRRAATASYIEDMLRELATMGKNINCDFLVFLLEMAQYEARNVGHGNPTPGRSKRGKEQGEEGLSAEELAALLARKPTDPQ